MTATSDDIVTLAAYVRDLVQRAADATAEATYRAEELVQEASELMDAEGLSIRVTDVKEYAEAVVKNLQGRSYSGVAFNAACEDAEAAAEIAKLAAERSVV